MISFHFARQVSFCNLYWGNGGGYSSLDLGPPGRRDGDDGHVGAGHGSDVDGPGGEALVVGVVVGLAQAGVHDHLGHAGPEPYVHLVGQVEQLQDQQLRG